MEKSESQEDFWNLFIKSFSAERLQIYLKLSDGSTNKAQALYLWNAKVSSELWEVVGYIEVSLRNSIDRQLSRLSSTPDWLDDPLIIKSTDSLRTIIDRAKTQASVYGRSPSHHQILDQLPLGFLQAILSRKYLYLWPSLAAGFLGANRGAHSELSALVTKLRKLRNRIGHHNHLLDLDLELEFANLLRIAQMIDPRLRYFFEIQSSVTTRALKRPH
jgi:hypothetical protein